MRTPDSTFVLILPEYKLMTYIKPEQILAIKETRLAIFNKSISNAHQTRIKESTLSQRVSPPLTRNQGEIRVYLLRLIIKECEREIRLRASLDTFIKDQNSYLLGLSGPQPQDSDRLETWSRLGVNSNSSPVGYEPNHDKLRNKHNRLYLHSELSQDLTRLQGLLKYFSLSTRIFYD